MHISFVASKSFGIATEDGTAISSVILMSDPCLPSVCNSFEGLLSKINEETGANYLDLWQYNQI